MSRKKRLIATVVAALFVAVLLATVAPAALAQVVPTKTVAAGETWVVNETTRLSVLTVAPGAVVTAPAGHALTLTVNGTETGQALVTTAGFNTALQPGIYMGNLMLTVTAENVISYMPPGPPGPPLLIPVRQALFIGAGGVNWTKSVPAALPFGAVLRNVARNLQITSTGEDFNGVYVAGGSYMLDRPVISLTGNGRSDFVGAGAAIVGTGVGTTLVVDGANILNDGVARAGVIADGGANVIVKNSHIQTNNGVLPADYAPTVDTSQMRSVPWMLSLSGNVRATNLLGTNTKASYINSYIGSEGWGVLSTDGCVTPQLTAINSTIAITGEDGYGSYGIGDATERFLGCRFDVGTYATISRGSFLYFGDSDVGEVARLNTVLGLGLTADELAGIPARQTVVESDRFGIMWHGGGTLDVSGGTAFNTKETTFLDKGQAITITVDGSRGAKLNPGNGVIMQVMDDDDPGPVMPGMMNTGVYHEPTGSAKPDITHSMYAATPNDAVATFSNITLKGNFYNSARGGVVQGPFGPPSSVSRNLVLGFKNAQVTGVITASTAKHAIDTITAADYRYLGEVTNTAANPVNNGVIVSLDKTSRWVVTGQCYLTGLTIDPGAVLTAAPGYRLTLLLGGKPRLMWPGTYVGRIELQLTPLAVK